MCVCVCVHVCVCISVCVYKSQLFPTLAPYYKDGSLLQVFLVTKIGSLFQNFFEVWFVTKKLAHS